MNQEKLNKQVQTEQVQNVIQDMNIKKQLAKVLEENKSGAVENNVNNNIPVQQTPNVQSEQEYPQMSALNRLMSKVKHNRKNNKKGENNAKI